MARGRWRRGALEGVELAAVVAGLVLVAGCGSSAGKVTADTTPPSVFPVPAAPSSAAVPATVTVTGSGTARTVTVLVGDSERVVRSVPLPYTTTVQITAGNPQVSVAAQSSSASPRATIACRITPRGGTPTSSSAGGAFATTTCTLGVAPPTPEATTTVPPGATTAPNTTAASG
jgi:hypothetical protein